MNILTDSKILLLVLSVIPVSLWITLVSADDAEYRLMYDLMRHYNKKVRPSDDHKKQLLVKFSLALSQIIDVDEKNQIITTNCWLTQEWIDVNLRWNPRNPEYNNLSVVRIPVQDVWKPDILLYNNADVMAYYSTMDSNVIVQYDGNTTWLSMMIFKSSCPINVAYFPFDKQNCTLEFGSWTYDGYVVDLRPKTDKGDATNYIPNSEWTLINLIQYNFNKTYSCCEEPYPMIYYYIILERRPLFYIFNMMFPCVLITLIALLGFYVPCDSGEKVTMGITTLLSMTVFLMMVADSMPPTKSELPLLGLYYGVTIAIVSFATAMTVITLNIHHKGSTGLKVPWFIRFVCFNIIGYLLCLCREIKLLKEKRKHLFNKQTKRQFGNNFFKFGGNESRSRWNQHSGGKFNTIQSGGLQFNDIGRLAEGHGASPRFGRKTTNSLVTNIRPPENSISTEGSVGEFYNNQKSNQSTNVGSCFRNIADCSTNIIQSTPCYHETNGSSCRNDEYGYHDSRSPPECNEYLCNLLSGQSQRKNDNQKNSKINWSPSDHNITSNELFMSSLPPTTSLTKSNIFENQFNKTLQKVVESIENNERRQVEKDRSELLKQEWRMIAIIIDRVLLISFIGATVAITAILILRALDMDEELISNPEISINNN